MRAALAFALLGLVPLSACGARAAPQAARAEPPAAAPKRATPSSARPPEPAATPVEREASFEPHCPEGMALLRRAQGHYCIDRWEAALVRVGKDGAVAPYPGNRPIDGIEAQVRAISEAERKPQGYISGIQADRVCRNAGKRLCEVDEWVLACRGSKLTRYPYGDKRRANVCNDRFKVLDHHPVPILFKKHAPPGTDQKLMWHPSWMNDSRLHEMAHTIVPTGSKTECTNDYAVYDMVGNLHEWVDDPAGTFMGGFFMDTFQNGEGCEYRTTGHGFEYHDYSTGFRCCADPEYRAAP